MAHPEVEPEAEHLTVPFRNGCELHRNLRHGKEDVQKLQCGRLRSIGGIPFEHVRVNGRRPGAQSQIDRANPVRNHIRRTVSRPEHAAVLADRRADVRLTEFDEDSGLDPVQVRHRLRKQPVGGFGQ